jgi:hypothetical protein
MYRYPFGLEELSLLGHSILMLPKGLKAAQRMCSEMSQGTPPKKILQERGELFWLRGGSAPDHVHVASLTATKMKNLHC